MRQEDRRINKHLSLSLWLLLRVGFVVVGRFVVVVAVLSNDPVVPASLMMVATN